MHDASVLEIDLDAIEGNLASIRDIVGQTVGVCAVIKSDAYGLGAMRVARRLEHAGADLFAVFTTDEAAELLRAGISRPILVMMPLHELLRTDELYRGLVKGQIHLVVHDHGHLERLTAITDQFGIDLPLHVEVDTGMSRGGCLPQDAPALLKRIHEHPRLRLAGVFTHFASPESDLSRTDEQLERFDRFLDDHADLIPKGTVVHAAATYALLRRHRFHKAMVRVGLAWTGFGHEWIDEGDHLPGLPTFTPCLTWVSRLVQIKQIPPGASVGYGSLWTTQRDTVLGVAPVGFAHGYPANLGSTARRHPKRPPPIVGVVHERHGVRVRHYAPVVGAVSMDQITIDLTDVITQCDGIEVNTRIEMLSPDPDAPNHLPFLSRRADIKPHQFVCGIHPRIRRVYTSRAASVHVELRPTRSTAGHRVAHVT